ncbi:MAG: hypothetical protein HKL82_04300 [Acidimicrobiaceae bacterium]|nr:hypothetical protein [Acidimicrobiaceae bacterium]
MPNGQSPPGHRPPLLPATELDVPELIAGGEWGLYELATACGGVNVEIRRRMNEQLLGAVTT